MNDRGGLGGCGGPRKTGQSRARTALSPPPLAGLRSFRPHGFLAFGQLAPHGSLVPCVDSPDRLEPAGGPARPSCSGRHGRRGTVYQGPPAPQSGGSRNHRLLFAALRPQPSRASGGQPSIIPGMKRGMPKPLACVWAQGALAGIGSAGRLLSDWRTRSGRRQQAASASAGVGVRKSLRFRLGVPPLAIFRRTTWFLVLVWLWCPPFHHRPDRHGPPVSKTQPTAMGGAGFSRRAQQLPGDWGTSTTLKLALAGRAISPHSVVPPGSSGPCRAIAKWLIQRPPGAHFPFFGRPGNGFGHHIGLTQRIQNSGLWVWESAAMVQNLRRLVFFTSYEIGRFFEHPHGPEKIF